MMHSIVTSRAVLAAAVTDFTNEAPELAFLLPPLMWVHGRRRRPIQ